MIEEIFIQNGFSDKEAKVYLAVLELGETPLSRIANQTHLKRTTVYSIVDTLKTKGIVSITKRKSIQYVSALAPQILIERFKRAATLAEQTLPELMEMAYSSPLKPRLRFFEGLNGIKEILREFSYSKIPSMGFTDYERMPKEMHQFIRKVVIPQRQKLNIRTRLLIPNTGKNHEVQKVDHKYFTEHRLVDFPLQENPIEILLFENSKIAFLSFTKNELFGIILDSKAIYQTLRNIFFLVWETSGKIR